MGLGDISYAAVVSLRTVDSWTNMINANLAAAGRVGHRAGRVSFGGTNTSSLLPASGNIQGGQVAEPTLTIRQTTVDFTPGAIVASNDPSHFAVTDKGFFLVDQRQSGALTNTGLGQDRNTYLLTRDGEFHWGPLEADGFHYMQTSTGLYVVSASISAGNMGNGALASELVRCAAPPSTDFTTLTDAARATRPGVVYTDEFSKLKFSSYGSTYFVVDNTISLTGINSSDLVDGVITGEIKINSLEASNGSLTSSVPELALAQKLYSALSKVISVVQGNLDTVLNLVR